MSHENLPPIDVDVTDHDKFRQYGDDVFVGHYYVFSRSAGAIDLGSDRRSRLAMGPAPTEHAVVSLTKDARVAGATIRRTAALEFAPVGCVVSDRDLYRAEDDVVNLFVALPGDPDRAELKIDADGSTLTTRELELDGGVAIETLAALLPGEYEARLEVDGRQVGESVRFTVAEYTLAPLSGRLMTHELDRSTGTLRFELAVERYQVPLDEAVVVELLDDDVPVRSTTVRPDTEGRFQGQLRLDGDGPFRLRVAPKANPGRTAEIVVPGTRSHERDLTLLNELGTEKLFSLMPEPGALPLRGGFVSDGDSVTTPLTVDEVVTAEPRVTVRADVRNLHATIVDQLTGEVRVVELGDRSAGDVVELDVDTALCTVVFGGWVGERPLEGYTSFARPSELDLELGLPESAEPGDDLTVTISVDGAAEAAVPVLVCIRDERLTATDTPEVGLASSWKSSVESVVSDMAESGFVTLSAFDHSPPWMGDFGPPPVGAPRGGAFDTWDQLPMSAPAASAVPTDFERVQASAQPRARRSSGLLSGAADVLAEAAGAAGEAIDSFGAGDLSSGSPPPEAGAGRAPRTDFAELVFYGLVHVEGERELIVPLADSTTTYVVEAFALAGGDWTQTREKLVVDQDVRIDLEIPSSVHPEDDASGWVRVATSSGRARITLLRDGESVPLEGATDDGVHSTPIELPFPVGPGEWEARVEDPDDGASDAIVKFVDAPGTYGRRVKALRLLRPGDSLNLDSADALTLRILPGLDSSFDSLVEASASYAHLCCEQTAAKMLSATFMYLTAQDDRSRKKAEKIIIAGAGREKKMFKRGKGFKMYPLSPGFSEYYSKLAVRYLWKLERLKSADVSTSLQRAIDDAIDLADAAADAHRMKRVPDQINSMDEAYATASRGGDADAAAAYVDRHLVTVDGDVRLKNGNHRVANRAGLAYAAATLAAVGDLERAIELADQVTREFNEQGRLYSTVDSVAAVVLMLELKAAGVADGNATVRVNGAERTATEAADLSDQVETVEVIDGVAAVEVTRVIEERWDAYESSFGVKVGFRDESGGRAKSFDPGERYQLSVELKDGYRNGDLVHVALPPSMAWLRGGGRVQTFTVDFEGNDEVSIPVIVTSGFKGKQHFAACVRNMFEEERASSPGLLTVKNKSGWFW